MSEAKLKQYQNAIDASNIVSKTNKDGIIIFANEEFCKISGYTKEELIGRSHNIVRHEDVPKEVFENLWRTILAKKVYKGILKNKAKNGKTFWLNATIIPILDKNGDIEEFVAIRHDVTKVFLLNERLNKMQQRLKNSNEILEKRVKKQTKKLIELNENLEKRVAFEIAKNEEKTHIMFRQSRLASMGEMIANIAHQWRQPLNELSIELFKMKQNLNNEDEFLKIYDHSKQIIKNMSKTIDDFSNFFKTQSSNEVFLLCEAVDEARAMLKATFEKENINLEIKCKRGIFVYGLKSEITHVLMNILANSKDAFKNNLIKEKHIILSTNIKNGKVSIDIFDNAGGIAKENLEKIFEPYFTTKHKSVGTGLGLYIVKMILDRMNGEISVRNYKKGANFKIILPAIEKEGEKK